jgi:hypothetical protein
LFLYLFLLFFPLSISLSRQFISIFRALSIFGPLCWYCWYEWPTAIFIARILCRISIICETTVYFLFFFFYGSTALVGLGRFFSSLIYTQSVDSLAEWSARRMAAIYTQDNTNTE